MKKDYLIIGGGPAGIAAAQAIRSNDSNGSILIVDREGERLYSKVNLHLMLDGSLPEENIYLKKDEFYKENRFELLKGEVKKLSEKKAVLTDGSVYDGQKVIVSSGGMPRKLGVAGEGLSGVYNFYSLSDCRKIKDALKSAEKIAIIGGGFITLDIIDTILKLKKKLTLICRDEHLLFGKISPEGARLLENSISGDLVEIKYKSSVKAFEGDSSISGLRLEDESFVECDLAILAIGITNDLNVYPDLQKNKGIIVDNKQTTNIPDVYACGDISEFRDDASGEFVLAGNWYMAQETGRVAGENASGKNIERHAFLQVSKMLFGLNLFFAGNVSTRYDSQQFQNENKFLQVFIKEDKVIGLTALNLINKIRDLKELIGNNSSNIDFKEYIS